VKGGFAAYLPPREGGGFGPAGKKAVGWVVDNVIHLNRKSFHHLHQ
jgi:hypothetical protein